MKGNALIQEAQGVTHGAVRCLSHITKGFFLHLLVFLNHQIPKPVGDCFYGNSLKVISLAPGKNGHRNFMHLRGGKYEYYIGRRFLQGF